MPPEAHVLIKPITWRNPYRFRRGSLLFQLHRESFRIEDRLRWRILRYPLFRLFPLIFRSGLSGAINLSLQVRGQETLLALRTRNLQFASLYLPQHAAGYEPETAALLDILVAPKGVFYDVGSNWGYYALWLTGRAGFHGKTHAFEPEPSSLADLRSAVAQAHLGDSIFCHGVGLCDYSGAGRLEIADGMHSGTATISPAGGRKIPLVKLDDLKLDPPTVIKVDAEGQEDRIFTGAQETLKAHRPLIVFESRANREHPAATLRPFQVLEELGYRFFHLAWAVREGGAIAYAPSTVLREGSAAELALVPFVSEQRFLLRDHLNILACPEDRLPLLQRAFQP